MGDKEENNGSKVVEEAPFNKGQQAWLRKLLGSSRRAHQHKPSISNLNKTNGARK